MSALGGKWKELMPLAKDVYTKQAEAGKAAMMLYTRTPKPQTRRSKP
jgi:hypothetical protein